MNNINRDNKGRFTKVKSFFRKAAIGTAIMSVFALAVIYGWEQVRPVVTDWYEGETMVYERQEEIKNEQEQTRIQELMNSVQAKEAGARAQEAEAKSMRLQELADEAKEIQASLM